MSHPPEYPGRGRLKRAAGSVAGDAYQGAFEAVMAVLVGAGFGYWADRRWGTTPYGVVVGIVVGFAAMVVRLLRIGRELPELAGSETSPGGAGADGGAESGSKPAAERAGDDFGARLGVEMGELDGADGAADPGRGGPAND